MYVYRYLYCRIGEEHIDAVTGISGSGPAYMYLILEAIAEEGVNIYMYQNLSLSKRSVIMCFHLLMLFFAIQ